MIRDEKERAGRDPKRRDLGAELFELPNLLGPRGPRRSTRDLLRSGWFRRRGTSARRTGFWGSPWNVHTTPAGPFPSGIRRQPVVRCRGGWRAIPRAQVGQGELGGRAPARSELGRRAPSGWPRTLSPSLRRPPRMRSAPAGRRDGRRARESPSRFFRCSRDR